MAGHGHAATINGTPFSSKHNETHVHNMHTRTQAFAHARARILNKLNKHIDQQVVIKKGTRPTVVTPKKCSHAVCVSFSIDVHTLL
jgi:hypothetical protein